ncbi:MAG: NAD-binding protein [Verrucomicrobiota bacterium]|nr:NAD-binding protein [Verrucomicrobiota bacterium]
MKEVIKSIPSVYKQRNKRKNLVRFFRFALVLVAFVCLYMHFYRELMSVERDAYVPWPEALYWVLTTMSTLGYGDIVFTGNAGRLFSMAVMFTGVFYLFIVLPFVFMEFLYKPFMEYQTGARVPRKFEPTEQKHVIITNYDSISHALMDKLTQFGYPFVLVVETMKEALRLHDMDIPVMLGNLDESDTFENAGIADAEMVVATDDDIRNVNIAFRARDASPNLTIVGTCNRETSEDILSLAGANHVIRTAKQMGSFLARRISCTDNNTHLIGRFDEVLIAEATIHGTPLVGKELKDANLREEYGVNVVGMWERGHFELPEPNAMLNNHTVLLMAGMEANFNKYDKAFSGFTHNNAPVIIIGAGRVGRETAKTLSEMNVSYRVIESDERKAGMVQNSIHGDASDKAVLDRAGINKAPAVVITSHNDESNIYLTIYCRKLRPDIQIITRAFLHRNVEPLHRAGADFVMSQDHMGANTIFNLLNRAEILMVTEGLDVFSQKTPKSLVGVKLSDCKIREKTGCSIVAIKGDTGTVITPSPEHQFSEDGEIILIGDEAAEKAFEVKFCPS